MTARQLLDFLSQHPAIVGGLVLLPPVLAFLVPVLWWKVLRAAVPARARVGAHLLLAMLAIQVTLGIATLLLVVPLPLAAAHQAGAVLLFASALNLVHALRRA